MSTPITQKPVDIIEAIKLLGEIALTKAGKTTTETIGERLVRLRKEKGITQKELAAFLRVTQPLVSNYETGELRLHGELIVQLANILGTTADELLGLEKQSRGAGTVKNRRLLRRVREIEKLPRRDQEALLRTIEAFLAKAG
jgi:transcriptional regulator with XRE-family HTH domain